ncbi:DnaA/Hda family protein [uncultured Litoreibacter sp.]|uniref:DnaA ATPase domain-containing protein n=1 Tax=uncultured Litoreibacter sp. TaxID=1392394 RepID=UPI00261B02BD|nr:DnaA/Hda family protein [uncultured Litoreibacter sp.]
MAEQLAFSLSTKPALGRDNFFVSEANQLAVTTLENSDSWPNGKLVLSGPAASGKTHLAHVWAGEVAARILPALNLSARDIAELATGPLVIEDIDTMTSDDEVALFHLHNLMMAEGHPLLMTTATAPAAMSVGLPDLLSRLQGTALVALDPPDDALLSVVLLKLFADKQINLPSGLLDYVLPRIGRSFGAAREFVDAIDARALREGKPIGKRLAGDILRGDAG